MRARAFALRDVFPDVLRGMPVAEEVMDTPTDRVEAVAAPPARSPQAAAASNAPDGLDDYEAERLPGLREAAMNGLEALQAAFEQLPKTKLRTALWTAHGASLKQAAQQALVFDAETGEIG